MTRGNRTCDLCGKPYYRRSVTETWDRQNPGHRDGWHKAIIRACTNCVTQRVAQRVMIVATVRAVVRTSPTLKQERARTNRFLRELERARQQWAARRDNVRPIRKAAG